MTIMKIKNIFKGELGVRKNCLAPTPARQDGGSNSSSSPVVNNLVLKKVFLNFTPQFTEACLIHRKVRVLCFALPVL